MSRQEVLAAAKEQIAREAQAVSNTTHFINEDFLNVAETLLYTKGKTFIFGSGTSRTIASRMAHLLSVTGTPSIALPPMDSLHGTMGAVMPEDIVLLISKGGRSDELIQLGKLLKEQGCTIVVLTEKPDSPLATLADICVCFSTPDNADPGNVIAMGSTLSVGVWSDALAYVLMRLRNRTWEQTLNIHPGGAVGKRQHILPEPLEPLSLED